MLGYCVPAGPYFGNAMPNPTKPSVLTSVGWFFSLWKRTFGSSYAEEIWPMLVLMSLVASLILVHRHGVRPGHPFYLLVQYWSQHPNQYWFWFQVNTLICWTETQVDLYWERFWTELLWNFKFLYIQFWFWVESVSKLVSVCKPVWVHLRLTYLPGHKLWEL
jgi:hypothetical protein